MKEGKKNSIKSLELLIFVVVFVALFVSRYCEDRPE